MITEEEARKKRCPYLGQDIRCSASDCMAWKQEDHAAYRNRHGKAFIRHEGDSEEPPEGYELFDKTKRDMWPHDEVTYKHPERWLFRGKKTRKAYMIRFVPIEKLEILGHCTYGKN